MESIENESVEEEVAELPLHRAARLGDIAALEQLVIGGADLNTRSQATGQEGLTPLMIAARSIDAETTPAIRWLLQQGADPTLTSEIGATAAWYAAGSVDREAFEPWVFLVPQPWLPDQLERLRLLLNAGAGVDKMTQSGRRTLLTEACRAGDPERVRLLLECGASPTADSLAKWRPHYHVPLFCAAESGSLECVQLLLDRGAKPETVRISIFAYTATAEIARLLLANGVRFDERDSRGCDALERLLESADERAKTGDFRGFEVADVLVEAGAELSGIARGNWTRLYTAAFWHQAFTVEYLLERGVPLEALKNNGSTPLHGVCWNDQSNEEGARIIRTLVSAGISLEARDDEGRTPLHEAAGGDGFQSIAAKTLLELGAEVDSIDGYGQTPLHIVAKRYTPGGVRILLEAGADPLLPDAQGKTPLTIATEVVGTWGDRHKQLRNYARKALMLLQEAASHRA